MPDAPPWLDRFRRRVDRLRRRFGPAWVAAVSGGGDSVALLRLLVEAGVEPVVAHLDHGARGEASAGDAQFVAGLAEGLGLTLATGIWRPTRPGHFEADARAARHAWLVDVARARGAAVVALGHTRDDQAETVLHRVLRGCGPRGLAGIRPVRRVGVGVGVEGVVLARPLIDVGRAELRRWLTSIGQSWREDASNFDVGQTRARLRHEVLPGLARDVNPRVVEALARLGSLARGASAAIDAQAAAIGAVVATARSDGSIAIHRRLLTGSSKFLQIEALRALWRDAGWPERAMDERRWGRLARDVVRGGPAGDFPAGVRLAFEGDLAILARPGPMTPPHSPVALTIPGVAPWAGGRVAVWVCDPRDVPPPGGECVDLDEIHPPLTVDAPRPGDRFDPLGLDGKSTAVADLLRGRGVPRGDRGNVAVVRDRAGIVCVLGHRIAHRVRLTSRTTRGLAIVWEDE